jgi:hypothetical protein
MKSIFRLSFLLLFILSQNVAKAQYDTIVYVNGTKQAAKVIEVSDKYLKFKNPLDTMGPTFSVPTKLIQQFIFKNGCYEMKELGYINCVKDPLKDVLKGKEFKRTIIGVDIFQAFISRLQLNAEHIFKGGILALGGYINIGFRDSQDTATYQKLECRITNGYYKNMYGGIDFKIYPGLQKKITPFISIGVEIGGATKMITQGSTQTVNNSWGGYQVVTSSSTSYVDRSYFGYHANFGATWRVTKSFVIQYNVSLGVNQFKNQDASSGIPIGSDFSPKIGLGVIAGFAF